MILASIGMFKNICWVNWLFFLMIGAFALISISTILSGCGNKGDLTLPEKSSTTSVETKKHN